MKINVMFCRFPGGHSECPESSDWVIHSVVAAKKDPRIENVEITWIADTPITMSRNRAIEEAKAAKVDLLFMIDSDMQPDIRFGADPRAKKFLDVALDLYFQRNQPFVLAVPYCGPPPHENVYVFRWRNFETNHPNQGGFALEGFTREEAAERAGIEEVGALPTGLCAIDMRLFTGFRCPYTGATISLKPPYFAYEWTDQTESKKASTEDVFFTRNASLIGCPQFVAWDCWAGHIKRKCVEPPVLISKEQVGYQFRDAILSGRSAEKRVCFPGEGLVPSTIAKPKSREELLTAEVPVVAPSANGHADTPSLASLGGRNLKRGKRKK